MKQLMMYRPAGALSERTAMPAGYFFSRYRGPEDVEPWLECCRDGLLEESDTETAFFRTIRDYPDVCMTDDVLFLDYEGRHVGTVTAIFHPDGCWGEMHMVALKRDFRGKGLGALLNQACIHKLETQGARYIELTTDEWRKAAVRSYLGCGFLPVEYDLGMPERWSALLKELGLSGVQMLNQSCEPTRTL